MPAPLTSCVLSVLSAVVDTRPASARLHTEHTEYLKSDNKRQLEITENRKLVGEKKKNNMKLPLLEPSQPSGINILRSTAILRHCLFTCGKSPLYACTIKSMERISIERHDRPRRHQLVAYDRPGHMTRRRQAHSISTAITRFTASNRFNTRAGELFDSGSPGIRRTASTRSSVRHYHRSLGSHSKLGDRICNLRGAQLEFALV